MDTLPPFNTTIMNEETTRWLTAMEKLIIRTDGVMIDRILSHSLVDWSC